MIKLTKEFSIDYGVQKFLDIVFNNTVIGAVSVIEYDSDETYIERIDVDEEFRNRGYGTETLNELSAIYGEFYITPDNEDAQRLYARLGNEIDSDNEFSYFDEGYGVFVI